MVKLNLGISWSLVVELTGCCIPHCLEAMCETLQAAQRVPVEKYDFPVTSSQEYGWNSKPLVGLRQVSYYIVNVAVKHFSYTLATDSNNAFFYYFFILKKCFIATSIWLCFVKLTVAPIARKVCYGCHHHHHHHHCLSSVFHAMLSLVFLITGIFLELQSVG